MRLILINPHSHNFGKMVSGVVWGRKSFLKYDYFVEFYLAHKRPLAFFIDGTRNTFGITWPIFPKFFCYVELLAWMLINRINPLRVPVYFSTKKLNPKHDVLFDFSRSLVDIDDADVVRTPWAQFKGLTFIHFTHYFRDVKKLSKRLARVAHPIVVAENDLTRADYFRHNFPKIRTVYHLPFAFADRFVSRVPYADRLNKCLAVGSIARVANKEFIAFFGAPEKLHPMRNVIYAEAKEYKEVIDSYIRGYNVTTNVRNVNAGDTAIAKLAKRFLPFVLLEKFYPTPQISYFKFNIVDKYNEYQMFICPEEVVGIPSINFVEGMACNGAYIGIEDRMYTDIGMIPGVHYIAYKKDDFEDFIAKVSWYQRHPQKLAKIASAGYAFVQEHFSRTNVAQRFWNDVEVMHEHFCTTGDVVVHSSFVQKRRTK